MLTHEPLGVSMLFRWLVMLLFVFGLATRAEADPWEGELSLGMSPADLLAIAARHQARIYDDESAGTLRVIVLSGQIVGQDTLLYVFFEDSRSKLIKLDFYLRSHASPPYPTMEHCRRTMLSIADGLQKRADLADLVPTIEAEPQGFGTIYTWRDRGMFAQMEFGAPRPDECGWIYATLFGGTEIEREAFLSVLSDERWVRSSRRLS